MNSVAGRVMTLLGSLIRSPSAARWRAACRVRAAGALAAAVAAAVLAVSSAARAELPPERLTIEKLPPLDPYRIYLVDPAMGHLVDGRVHVIDGARMRYLGLLGTGFAGTLAQSRDRKTLFVATTYHSRLQRGNRSDVVEVYRSDDLGFQYEIEIPPKHVQGLQIRAMIATSVDDRWLLVQNATPATSVSIIDVAARRVVAEVPTPGCYGVIAWPAQPRRFSSVCGDGTLATFDIDEHGAFAASSVSAPFFDADSDPVFMHYELVGDRLSFVTYHGQVLQVDLTGVKPTFAKPWSLLDAAARKQGWRPGGYELFAIEPRSGRLYVAMHDRGAEGTHKNPAKEIWVIDLASQRRVARLAGHAAVAMAIARADRPRLFVLSGADNRLLAFDLSGPTPPKQPLARSEPFGETPVFLELP